LFIYAGLGFELRAFTLSHSTNPIFVKVFQNKVSPTICPGWIGTVVLLISASRVTRITGVSHQHPAHYSHFYLSCDL
jgi:hypothetical protein